MYIEIIVNKLAVRINPNKHEKIVRFLNKGDILTIIKKEGNWILHEYGWSLSKEEDNIYIKPILLKNKPQSINRQNQSRADLSDPGGGGESTNNIREEREGDVDYSQYNSLGVTSGSASHFLTNVRGIHGMPYQFMESVDRRLPDSIFGRKYASKIVSRIPLLLLTPGRPDFMDGYSNKQKDGILAGVVDKFKDNVLNNMINTSDGKYYSFKFAYKEYYQFVNPMLQKMSIFLGIGDETIDGTSLRNYDWSNYTNSALKNFVSSKEIVAFYLDSDTQISESFSNDSRDSALASTVNGLSDMAKEIQFLIGGVSGQMYENIQGNSEAALEELNSFQASYSSLLPQNLIGKLKEGFLTLTGGGRMMFPEIWADSNFSRSYDVSIKLRSPDGDKFSLFMNIFVPMIHLIAFAAPQQLGNNGYNSPFLVRGHYKGFFTVDMGLIGNLNINKGDKGKWTVDGLPTEVDITMSIKDLYQMMAISSEKNLIGMLNNTMLLDYLANLCGVNINKPDIQRSIDLFYTQIKNSYGPTNLITDGFSGVENSLTNMLNSLYKR